MYQEWKAPKRDRWLALRRTCVTSTDMPVLVGAAKYGRTPWSVWAEKTGTIEDEYVETSRTKAGKEIEQAIARLVEDEIGAPVRRLRDFAVRDRMGASYDYEVTDGVESGWLVEIKNVDQWVYRDEWEPDDHGIPQPPPHIQVQVQHQLEVSQRPGTIVAALVGGNDLQLRRILRDPEIGDALRTVTEDFWGSVEGELPPPPVEADDAQRLARIPIGDAAKVFEADDGSEVAKLVDEYEHYRAAQKQAEAEANARKARLLQLVGDSTRIETSAYRVDTGWTREAPPKTITEEMVGQETGGRRGFRRFVPRPRTTGGK